MPRFRKTNAIGIPQPEGWQCAVIAALARGRQLQEAWAEAGIGEQRFHERVAADPAFRDACREAIESARQRLAQDLAFIEHTIAPEPAPDSTAISAPESIPTLFSQQMPAWAATLFGALLAGRPPDAARADAGVTEEQIRVEQEHNPLFHQVWRKFQAGSRAGRWAAFEALLDRTIAAAVVAARALPPQTSPEQPHAGWVGSFLRAWRDGRSLMEAARAARVSLEAVEEVHAQNAPFAQACTLLALASAVAGQLSQQRERITVYMREQQEDLAAALRANMPLAEAIAAVGVARETALIWTETIPTVREAYVEQQHRARKEMLAREAPLAEAFLAALAQGTEPREAAVQVGWIWAAARQRRSLDSTFAQVWDAVQARVRAEREALRKKAFLAALARGLNAKAAAREAHLSQPHRLRAGDPSFARAWDDAAAEGERALAEREAEQKEAFLAALARGLSPTAAARKAHLSRPDLLRKSNPAFAQAWDDAVAEGERARAEREAEQKEAFLAALARGLNPTLAAREAKLSDSYRLRESDPAFAQAWDDALAAGRRARSDSLADPRRSAVLAARKEAFERALAVRRSGGQSKDAAAAAGVSRQTLSLWMKADPALAAAWQAASEEGKRARIDPAIVAQQQEQERARVERRNTRAMKQRAALDARREGKTLAAAASAAGVIIGTIQRWRQVDPDFAAAWDNASEESRAPGAARGGRP